MQQLFESSYIQFVLLLFLFFIVLLPRYIIALYKREHVDRLHLFPVITGAIMFLFWLIYLIVSIINEGFNSFSIIFGSVVVIFIIFLIIYSQFIRLFYKKKKMTIRRIYYGKEHVEDEIEEINKTYQQYHITKSASNSPLQVQITFMDKQEINDYITKFEQFTALFEDITVKKYRIRLYSYIFIYCFSAVFTLSYLLYFITTIL